MKKKYLSPAVTINQMTMEEVICSSVYGVSGTGNLTSSVGSDDTTDEYLSRWSFDEWDASDEWDF